MIRLLTHASQLLTLRRPGVPGTLRRGPAMRELAIITDGAVLIRDSKIVAAGTTDELRHHELLAGGADAVEEIDCRKRVVLPGFVDSHTHPVFTAARLVDFEKRILGANYEEIAQAGGGIRASLKGVRETELAQLSAQVLERLREMSAQGTTTVEAKSGYGLTVESEIKSLRAIREAARQWPGTVVPTLLGAHVVPPEYRDDPEAYMAKVCDEMIPQAAASELPRTAIRQTASENNDRLADFVDVFCERGAFSMEQSQRILRAATKCGLGTRVHICQLTPAKLETLLEFNPASVDHMDFVSDDDLNLLARKDVVATLLPAANYFLGLERYPPARKLIDNGVAVALATDYNPGTAPTPSMPFVLSAACTHMHMTPAEAITAATYNGACALRMQTYKGSIEPGKDADIAIFEADDFRELAYWVGVNRCCETLLKGKSRRAGKN